MENEDVNSYDNITTSTILDLREEIKKLPKTEKNLIMLIQLSIVQINIFMKYNDIVIHMNIIRTMKIYIRSCIMKMHQILISKTTIKKRLIDLHIL